jgi:hypothetical protein
VNTAQRVVIVVGLGIALYLFGSWLIGYWEFGGSPNSFGWVGYAPLSGTVSRPGLILHPWVRLLIWLALTTIWVVTSAVLLRSQPGVDAGRSRTGDVPGAGSAG